MLGAEVDHIQPSATAVKKLYTRSVYPTAGTKLT